MAERLKALSEERDELQRKLAAAPPKGTTWRQRFADEVRGDKQYAWIAPLHYINVPRGATSVDGRRDALKEGEVVSAIIRYRGVLADRFPRGRIVLAAQAVRQL